MSTDRDDRSCYTLARRAQDKAFACAKGGDRVRAASGPRDGRYAIVDLLGARAVIPVS